MTQVQSPIRGQVRSPIRGQMTLAGSSGDSFHDGISFDAATGRVVLKAVGAAPTITTLAGAFTFTGGNQSMYMGPAGLLVPSVTNTPRIEYDASGNCLGLLMEAARTNLCLQSQVLGTTWAATRSSVSSNAITAPDGTSTADKLVEDSSAAATHFIGQAITKAASSIQYTFSVWLKAGERTTARIRLMDVSSGTNGSRADIDLSAGTITSATNLGAGWTGGATTIVAFPSGWYRCSLVATSDTGTNVQPEIFMTNPAATPSYNGDGASGFYVWGAQVESGAFPSSYIPTTTVSVARTADSCIRTLGSEFSATAGSVIVQGRASGGQDASLGQAVFSFDDGTLNERFCLTRSPATDTANYIVTDGGVAQAVLGNTLTNSTAFKACVAFAANDAAVSFNGNAIQTDATVTLPTVTTLNVGGMALSTQMNGHIRQFDYYPTRLPNNVLQQRAA